MAPDAAGVLAERADVPAAGAVRTPDGSAQAGRRARGHAADHRHRGRHGPSEDEPPAVDRVGTPTLDEIAARVGEERAVVHVAPGARLGAAGVVLVVAAHLLDLLEGDRDHRGRSELVLRRHSRGDHRVEGQHAPRAGDDQRDPGEEEHDVGPRVVRRGVEAHREEEHEGEQGATGGGDPRPEAKQRAQPDGQLGHGNEDADGHGEAEEVPEERVQRADPDRRDQLSLNARWARRVEEVRVGQLLQTREAEGEAEERPQGQHRPAGEGGGTRWRRVEAHPPPSSCGRSRS